MRIFLKNSFALKHCRNKIPSNQNHHPPVSWKTVGSLNLLQIQNTCRSIIKKILEILMRYRKSKFMFMTPPAALVFADHLFYCSNNMKKKVRFWAILKLFHRELESNNKSSKSIKTLQYLRFEQSYIIKRANFQFWVLRSTCRWSADFQTQDAAKKCKKM